MKHILALSIFALTATAFAAPAMADDDMRIYEQNKAQYISLAKASKLAKAHIKGTSVKKVEFDHDHHLGAHFDVDVFNAKGVEYHVSVDAKTGKILKSEIDD